MKKIISMCLAMIMMISFFSPAVKVNAADTQDLDEMDVVLAACYYLYSDNEAENMWPENARIKNLLPLYDTSGNIVAWYIHFYTNEYAIINNSRLNPAALEFGDNDNAVISEILKENAAPHIVYNNMNEIYDATVMMLSENSENLYTYYPDLEDENTELAELLAVRKEYVKENATKTGARGDDDYGFLDPSDLPVSPYTSGSLPGLNINWAVTSSFNDIASNHCGAVCVTNLALYFGNNGYSSAKYSTIRDTFVKVHSYVGNGPKMTIASDAVKYFSFRGYTLKHSSVSDVATLKTAIGNEHPCAILLANGIVDWHWVMVVGWRYYIGDGDYLRIVDGWDNTSNLFYRPFNGSFWAAATEYWIA